MPSGSDGLPSGAGHAGFLRPIGRCGLRGCRCGKAEHGRICGSPHFCQHPAGVPPTVAPRLAVLVAQSCSQPLGSIGAESYRPALPVSGASPHLCDAGAGRWHSRWAGSEAPGPAQVGCRTLCDSDRSSTPWPKRLAPAPGPGGLRRPVAHSLPSCQCREAGKSRLARLPLSESPQATAGDAARDNTPSASSQPSSTGPRVHRLAKRRPRRRAGFRDWRVFDAPGGAVPKGRVAPPPVRPRGTLAASGAATRGRNPPRGPAADGRFGSPARDSGICFTGQRPLHGRPALDANYRCGRRFIRACSLLVSQCAY